MGTVRSFLPNTRPVTPGLHPWAVVKEIRILAAEKFGWFIAAGLLHRDECLLPLMQATIADGYRGSVGGLQTKFCWVLADHASAWERRRGEAERAIRRRLAPMLDAHMPTGALTAAAWQVNEAHDSPLLRHEAVAVAAEEVGWFVRRLQREQRTRRGARRYG